MHKLELLFGNYWNPHIGSLTCTTRAIMEKKSQVKACGTSLSTQRVNQKEYCITGRSTNSSDTIKDTCRDCDSYHFPFKQPILPLLKSQVLETDKKSSSA